jgi:hypothetical protein
MNAEQVAPSSLSTIRVGRGQAIAAYDIRIKAPDGTELHGPFNPAITVTVPVPLKADGGKYTLNEAPTLLSIWHVLDEAAERITAVTYKDLDGDGYADVAVFDGKR